MHYFIMILLASFFYASDAEQPTWARDLVLTGRTNVYVGIGFSSDSTTSRDGSSGGVSSAPIVTRSTIVFLFY